MQHLAPTIEIHLAYEDDGGFEIRPLRSPYSPKFPSPMAYSDSDADDFRPTHLLPPPVVSPIPRPSTTLPVDKKGIDQTRFEQLLQGVRQKSAPKFGHARKDSAELRRQATLKAHTSKALERRALFLSKIGQPPSPSATESPVTPPESPAIFHFSLPSPGLQSPIAVFERLAKAELKKSSAPTAGTHPVAFPTEKSDESKARVVRVEEVDFKARARTISIRNGGRTPLPNLAPPVPHRSHARRASAHALPSLDQITARLAKPAGPAATPNDLAPILPEAKRPELGVGRLSARLGTHKRSPSSPLATMPVTTSTSDVQVLPTSVEKVTTCGRSSPEPVRSTTGNRLPAFLQKRSPQPPQPPTPTIVISSPDVPVSNMDVPVLPSGSVEVSRVATATRRRTPSGPPPTQLLPSEPFVVRAMPTRLPYLPSRGRPATPETRKQRGLDMVEKLRRRSSAPASLPALNKKDAHPVLSIKGGF